MPRKTDAIAIKDKALKKSAKLLDCQRERIKSLHSEGFSITGLGKMFKVNKRLIQFIIFPERQKRNLELREQRGGSKIYYNKEKHTAAIREHRKYKKELFKKITI
jgi:hypothetical protein